MRKRHFNVGETKAKILEFILESSGPITEPNIRAHLSENFNDITQSTINKHLNFLKAKGCIERVSPIEKTRLNYWDVISFDQLKNIRSEFEDVKLNGYEKAIILVLQKNGYRATDIGGFFTYIQLLLSNSFFIACIDTSIDTLSSRFEIIYHYNNAGFYRKTMESLDACYNAYTEQYPDIEIPKAVFSSILVEISGKHNTTYSDEVFIRVWNEKIQKVIQEKPNEIIEDQKIYKSIRDAVEKIKYLIDGYKDTLFSLVFESYFFQDVMLGNASEEEITFAIGTKANSDEYIYALDFKKDKNEISEKLIFCDFEQAGVVMANHKQPSLFDKNVYDSKEDINQSLRIYFKTAIKNYIKSIENKSFYDIYPRCNP